LIAAIPEQRCVAFSHDGLRKVRWHMPEYRPAWFFRQTKKPQGLRPGGFCARFSLAPVLANVSNHVPGTET
jgi:hypothetical protein